MVFAGLPLCIYWVNSKEISVNNTRYSGTLIYSPGNQGTITLIQIGDPKAIYGPPGIPGVTPVLTDSVGQMLIPFLEESQFKVEAIDGRFKVSTQITDGDGNIIVEIVRNEWKVAPPPGTWDRNYTDDALEVKDPKGRIVLQTRVLPDRIQIQGAWILAPTVKIPGSEPEYVFIIGDKTRGAGMVFVPARDNGFGWPQIRPMFEYPSDKHLGELLR